ncbi:SDR family NAD(P)-dependent oxidoreductase [Amycolatopsis sp. cmx-4-83]|uniref:SDR family NAD(P)-dependent oxidoreductase n=1 Tax=Amycolatopsis sp. cmx-4-83 TaxID=2790940 RepID=UPI00397E5C56
MTEHHPEVAPTDIAIIGMSLRLPGAADPDAFWQRITEGEEQLTVLTDEDLRAAGVSEELLANPDFIRVTSMIDDAGDFDADFFGITPSEARLMDPQHRLLLELCWQALEDAGYEAGAGLGDVGVFAGGGRHAYLRYVEPHFDEGDFLDGSIHGLQADIGNYGDFLATRVSYKLGLTGPSLNLQTACSTALVAVHVAVQSLVLGESDVALAGGVNLHTPQVNGYLYEEGSICSPDGHLRPFDADANGSVFGNGGGIVALKRLEDALADQDRVIAVIKGTAINNDGADKMSFTAPSVPGQAEVIARAHRVAGVDPRTIGFVETHGTGTALGDPIEVAALISAFDLPPVEQPFCALGAVKAQIGHLGPAAGIAGLIKAALALERGQIPPTVNHRTPNPAIAFTGSPFYVPVTGTGWPGLRRAGVSAFGVGGTNAHAVLEQPPSRPPARPDDGRPVPVVLSARSATALEALRASVGTHLSGLGEPLSEAAHVLATGRRRLRHRLAVAAADPAEAARLLAGATPVAAPEAELPVVFAFPGQGAQFVGAGRGLYDSDPVYRGVVDELSERLLATDGLDVRTVLLAGEARRAEAAVLLRQALWAQPTIFITEYALARSLTTAGITPDLMIGHSIGEYAAAALAGILTPEDALKLVAARGRLMHSATEPGAMMAVGLAEADLRRILPADLDIAAVNTTEQSVVSGPVDAIARFDDELARTDLLHTVLGTSLAAHSSLMDPIVEPFREIAESVRYHRAGAELATTLRGGLAEPGTLAEPGYWAEHLRSPVLFRQGAQAVLDRLGQVLVVEVGPGRALTGMFRQIGADSDPRSVTPWVAKDPELASPAAIAAAVWAQGGRVDWPRHFAGSSVRRTRVPGYPFERSTYWLEEPRPAKPLPYPSSPLPLRRRELLQQPVWTPTPAPEAAPARRRILALVPPGHALPAALAAAGHDVVVADAPFAGRAEAQRFLDGLSAAETLDSVVVVPPEMPGDDVAAAVAGVVEGAFWPAVWLVSALAARRSAPLDLVVVTRARHDGTAPELALLAGPAKVLPQEYPSVRAVEVDVDAGASAGSVAGIVLTELTAADGADVVAYHGGERRTLGYAPVREPGTTITWRSPGRYLITGGLGGIGLALAGEAARRPGITLVLTHRTELPDPAIALADPATPPRLRGRLAAIAALREAGAQVHVVRADVADRDRMREVREAYGPFTGVVHAAGVPGGRLIDAIGPEDADRVFAPKVRGALVLDEVVADEATEWLVLCSSVSSVVGGVGHVDYCAANAFLDAFARTRTDRGRRTVSLGYDAWTESGMAVDEAARSLADRVGTVDHPVLTGEHADGEAKEFRGELQDTDWVVAEHRVADVPVLPGTGIIELLHAAAGRAFGQDAVEIGELDLLRPLAVPPGAATEVAVRLEGGPAEFKAVLRSRRDRGPWTDHATGLLRRADPDDRREPVELPAGAGPDTSPAHALTAFGPRWDNVVRTARTGAGELLVECALPDRFTDEGFGVHPALLDTAAGSLLGFVTDAPHLPISYERVTVHRPMPSRVRSRITERPGAQPGFRTFDVVVRDEQGTPVIELDGYAVRQVEKDDVTADLATRPAANRALVSTDPGDLGALRFRAVERAAPAPGEVSVEVLAAGLNFKEVLIANGMLDADEGHRFGLEAAGIVREVGEGVTEPRVGDAVMAIGSGCLSDHVTVRAELTAPVPAGLSFTQAATVPIAFATAYDALVNVAGLRAGERVLVHAVTGGVGLAAHRIARHLGAEVFGTAGNRAKREFAAAEGVVKVMDSRSLAFERETLEDGGVDVVLNALAGDFIPAGLRTLRERGRFVELGRRDILAGAPLDLNLFATGRTFSSYYPDSASARFTEAFRQAAALVSRGVIAPLPVHAFSTDQVGEAFSFLSRAQHIGKVVVTRPGAEEQPAPAGATATEGITNRAGVRAFHGALALGGTHVLASARNFGATGDDLVVAEHVLHDTGSAVHARPDLAYRYVPPESETERLLGAVWAGVLSIDQVGREDRFLDLGGDSLYATQVVARVRKEFGVRVAPANVLGELPLRALAAQIDEQANRD